MKAQSEIQLQFARDRRSNDLRRVENARLVGRSARAARASLRRVVGRRMVAIGERLAADSTIQPARSR